MASEGSQRDGAVRVRSRLPMCDFYSARGKRDDYGIILDRLGVSSAVACLRALCARNKGGWASEPSCGHGYVVERRAPRLVPTGPARESHPESYQHAELSSPYSQCQWQAGDVQQPELSWPRLVA